MNVEDEEAIILRKSSRRTNKGLVELLLACPYPFEIPEREKDDAVPLEL